MPLMRMDPSFRGTSAKLTYTWYTHVLMSTYDLASCTQPSELACLFSNGSRVKLAIFCKWKSPPKSNISFESGTGVPSIMTSYASALASRLSLVGFMDSRCTHPSTISLSSIGTCKGLWSSMCTIAGSVIY